MQFCVYVNYIVILYCDIVVYRLHAWSMIMQLQVRVYITTMGKLFTRICLCCQAVKFGREIIWEVNGMSRDALATGPWDSSIAG